MPEFHHADDPGARVSAPYLDRRLIIDQTQGKSLCSQRGKRIRFMTPAASRQRVPWQRPHQYQPWENTGVNEISGKYVLLQKTIR